MVVSLERDIFNAHIPNSPCKAETRAALDEMAKKLGISRAQVVRYAVEFFLTSEFGKSKPASKSKSKKGGG